jgi:hypothetical protein
LLEATVFAPVDRQGATVVGMTIHSRDVGQELGVEVVIPPGDSGHTRGRPLLIFLHGHGGSDNSYTEDEAFFRGLASLGRRAPVVAFPDGGEDRRWGSYVTGE